MQQRRQRVQCEACLGNHSTDSCRARGFAFLDSITLKRVEQINANTPKKPPQPPTPPTASFASKLKDNRLSFRALTLCQPVVDQSEDQSSGLTYHPLRSTDELDTTLNQISDELVLASSCQR